MHVGTGSAGMGFPTDIRQWAWDEFGDAALGDCRRVTRLVTMAMRVAERPGGRISDVFVRPGESQGAYDFVRNSAISPGALINAVGTATARRCADYKRIVIPIDGSSLALTDHNNCKDFGRVGTAAKGGRGLKMMSAAAVGSDGVFLGLLDVQWWARGPALVRRRRRPLTQRETQRWIDGVSNAARVLKDNAPETPACFVLDREGDSRHVLKALEESGQEFIVRSRANRRLVGTTLLLREKMQGAPVRDRYVLALPRTGSRAARVARLEIRAARVTIVRRSKWGDGVVRIPINVVHVRELGTSRRARLQWTLLTNRPIETTDQVRSVARDYTLRWRIEEFHRTWKRGHCNVEHSQLRRRDHIIRWAMIHAAVAARIERLKGVARANPKAPATTEFSRAELQALVLVRHRYNKDRDDIELDSVSIQQATRWLAEIGGFMGGDRRIPGSVTLGRGLERLAHYVEAFDIAFSTTKSSAKKR